MIQFSPILSESVVLPPTLLVGLDITKLSARATLDLRTFYAAILFIDISKTYQPSARTSPITLQIRRMIGEDTINPAGITKHGTISAYSGTTFVGASGVGNTSFTVSSSSGFSIGNKCCIFQTGSESISFELVTISSISSNTIHVTSPLIKPHVNGSKFYNGVDSFNPDFLQIPGGAIYEIIFDCAGETIAAESIVRCAAQVYEGDLATDV